MTYRELRDAHQKQFNDYSDAHMFFAFSKSQFAEGMAKFGLSPNKKEDLKKVVSVGYGGYSLRSANEGLHELMAKLDRELHVWVTASEENAYDALLTELYNHEYCITGDLSDGIYACSLSVDEINESPMLQRALHRAAREAAKEV